MKLKQYNELTKDDIWTTNGIYIQFHAMKGKEGIPIENITIDDADIFVPGYSIPDEFFD